MGRVKLSVARRRGPVVLHLDRDVAHDLLLALTQALEPHSTSTGKLKKSLKGVRLKAKSVTGKSAKGKSPKGKAAKRKNAKGKRTKRSR
jgi:hypothetical protein